MTLLDRILLSHYCASVSWGSRYEPRTYHLLAHTLVFVLMAILFMLIYLIPYRFSVLEIMGMIGLICLFAFWGIRKWVKYHLVIKKGNIRSLYKQIREDTFWYTLAGWVFYFGSFALVFIVGTYTVKGMY